MGPGQSVTERREMCVFFVSPDIWSFFWGGIFGPRYPKFRRKKKKNFENGSTGAHRTRAQKIRIRLKKMA